MRVGIIGAGFTGLTTALRLVEKGVEVVVWEKEEGPGGLAIGFKDKQWGWALERHYHHVFTSDNAIKGLAVETGAKYFFSGPKTSCLWNGKIVQLDSPTSLIRFGGLGFGSRIKTGAGIAYLRHLADWRKLEGLTAEEWLKNWDKEAYGVIWEPLLAGKFGERAGEVGAAWFWARIKKRSRELGYFEGGFGELARKVEKKAKTGGAKFIYGAGVRELRPGGGRWKVKTEDAGERTGGDFEFDKVLVTGSSFLLAKLAPQLPRDYKEKLAALDGLGAVNLVLALKRPFFEDGTYWLNVNQKGFPFVAVVEQTNFVESRHYGGDRLIYVGNYLPANHKYFGYGWERLVGEFLPFLKKINGGFEKEWIRKGWVFKAPFAQPLVTTGYSAKVLPYQTPLPGLYWGGIQQVYPWDRGTNYAVEMGEEIAELIINGEGENGSRI